MACELITAPTGGAPLSNADYDAQNQFITACINKLMFDQLHLTEWDTLNEPKIKQGVYVQHGGALFQVKDANEDISGAGGLANGRVYIKVTRAGDVLTFSFTNSAVGYEWDYTYNGFYHAGGTQLLPYVLYKTASGYHKYTLQNSKDKYDITALIEVMDREDIGIWDMDADQFVNVPYNDIIVYFTTIYTTQEISERVFIVKVNIINDAETSIYTLEHAGGGNISPGANGFQLIRNGGELFDYTSFNDNTINRGDVLYLFYI